MKQLEVEFHKAMVAIYLRAKDECGYNATRIFQMVNDIGGVEAARTLLRKGGPSEGFATLWECGRLDLTVEAHVLQLKFQVLRRRRTGCVSTASISR